MLWIVLGIVAAVIAALILIIALRPNSFQVVRVADIAAPPQELFSLVNDFHQWDHWSPWAKLDPNMKTDFDGPSSGTGSKYHWIGDKKVGEGRMTILESRPPGLVRIKLEFIKPWTATNETRFTFEPMSACTRVTWKMTGNHNTMTKVFCLFMNMDKVVGKDFEKGLAAMKTLTESKTAQV